MESIIILLCVVCLFLVGAVIALIKRLNFIESTIITNNTKIVSNTNALWKCAQQSNTKISNVALKVARLEKRLLNVASYTHFEG